MIHIVPWLHCSICLIDSGFSLPVAIISFWCPERIAYFHWLTAATDFNRECLSFITFILSWAPAKTIFFIPSPQFFLIHLLPLYGILKTVILRPISYIQQKHFFPKTYLSFNKYVDFKVTAYIVNKIHQAKRGLS